MKQKLLGTRFVAAIARGFIATFDDRATENAGDLLLLVVFGTLFASLASQLT